MALKLRRTSASRVRLLSTLIAVFALLAQPMYGFVASQVANAAAGRSETVRTASELLAAAGDQEVATIKLGANISLEPSERLIFSGRAGTTLVLDGKGYTLSMINNPAGWNQNDENYVIQAYKSSVKVQDITISGGDAAILVNGATVELNNSVNVSNNTFGGIEVSQGVGVTTPAILKGTSNLVLTNNTEANGQPTAWIDQANMVNPATAVKISKLKETTHIGNNQKQYYLSLGKSNTVATNTTKRVTYDNLQTAMNEATTGEVVRLETDINLPATSKSFLVKSAITLDGNGKTVSAAFNRGPGGVSNAEFVILSSNVVVENLTVKGNGLGKDNATHGIVVDKDLTGVTLRDITAIDGAAGVIVNTADVTIERLHTVNNAWYGVNVDGKYGPAKLTVVGGNTHTEQIAIFAQDTVAPATVIGDLGQYAVKDLTNARIYAPKLATPTNLRVTAKAGSPAGTVTVQGCDIYTNDNFVTLNWDAVPGAVGGYDYNIVAPGDKRVNAHFPSNSTSGSFNLADEAKPREGKFTWNVAAKDANGVISSASTNCSMTYDKTPSSLGSSVLDKSINPTKVTVNATDATSGVGTVQYSIYTMLNGTFKELIGYTNVAYDSGDDYSATLKLGLDKAPKPSLGIDSFFKDDFSLKDGSYFLRVRAYDNAGNKTNNVGIDRSFKIDHTDPEIFSTTYNPVSKTLTVVTNDDADKVVLTVGSTDVALKSRNGNTWVFDVASFSEPGATYKYTATATDVAGNTSTTDTANAVTNAITRRSFTIADPFIGGPSVPLVDPNTPGFGPVANPAVRSFFAVPSNVVPVAEDAETDVLGARDTKTASPEKTMAVIEPSAQGWKLFGFAWFWWVLLGAAIAAGWWMIAAARRRRDDAAY